MLLISPLENKPLGDVSIDNLLFDDVLLGDALLDDVPLDDVPLDDVVDNSIVCLGAFLISGCLMNAFLSGKIFISCCDNSTMRSIMQGSNQNFKANFPPVIL